MPHLNKWSKSDRNNVPLLPATATFTNVLVAAATIHD